MHDLHNYKEIKPKNQKTKNVQKTSKSYRPSSKCFYALRFQV